MNKLVDTYFSLLKALIVLCLAIMVVLVFTNVVLRYAFHSGISVSEELSRWAFVYMTFIGAVIGLRERAHLGTDMLIARLPSFARKLCVLAAHGMMLYVCWLLFIGSWEQTIINLDVAAPASSLASAPILLHQLYTQVIGREAHQLERVDGAHAENAASGL
jgi:TRAP-type C4-dicarboxylate transport system permease small subunit